MQYVYRYYKKSLGLLRDAGASNHCRACAAPSGTSIPYLVGTWHAWAFCIVSSPSHILEGGAASGEARAPPHQVRWRR